MEDTEILVPTGEQAITQVSAGDEVIAHDPAAEEDWIAIEELDPMYTCDPALDPNCAVEGEVGNE